MKIRRVINSYIGQFRAELECETCGHVGDVVSDWGDKFFRDSCIPQMTCIICGCNSRGQVPDRAPDVRPPSV